VVDNMGGSKKCTNISIKYNTQQNVSPNEMALKSQAEKMMGPTDIS
jgi:hypothetical protein